LADEPLQQAAEAMGLKKVLRDDPLTPGADTNYIRFTGGEHVVLGGSSGADTLIGGDGDDALWGDAGNDRLEGGFGVDLINGGAGDDHGGTDPRSRTIPWIIAGPGVKKGLDLTLCGELRVRTEDTFATACWLLDIPLDEDLDGKVIAQAFE
jgi:hypothetical protein